MKEVKPVTFDGFIYIAIALFTFWGTFFGTDEAAKYVKDNALFWIKFAIGSGGAAALALKLYRSTTFADYRQAKNGSYHTGDTQLFTKKDDEKKTPPVAP